MGVSYHVYPLNAKKQDFKEYLDGFGQKYPDSHNESRYPTLNEILEIARSLPGYTVESHVNESGRLHKGRWQIVVEEDIPDRDGGYAILNCLDYKKATEPCSFYVYRGDPETIVLLMKHLASICGPFLVICDGGESIVVTAETELEPGWSGWFNCEDVDI